MAPHGLDLPPSLALALEALGFTAVGAHAGLLVYVGPRGDRVVTVRRVDGDVVAELHVDGRYAAAWRADAGDGRAARSLGEAVEGARGLAAHADLRRLARAAASALEPLGLVQVAAVHEGFTELVRLERVEPTRVVACDVTWDHREQWLELVVAVGPGPLPVPVTAALRDDAVTVRWRHGEARPLELPFAAWLGRQLAVAAEQLRLV